MQRERLAETTKQLVLGTKCAKQPPPPEVAAIETCFLNNFVSAG